MAQEESNRQTHLLMREIESHRQTDEAAACRQRRSERAAEQANQAKSRYISAISHELRTPLNSILGYAQLLGEDAAMPPHRKQAVQRDPARRRAPAVADRGHAGHRAHRRRQAHARTSSRCASPTACTRWRGMFELQAAGKGMAFRFERGGRVARGRARRREAGAPDPDQPAGQRHQVHGAGPGDFPRAPCARDGAHRDRGHRPRHDARGAGADLRALRSRLGGRRHAGRRRRPGPDHRQDAHGPDGRRADGDEHAGRAAPCSASSCSCPERARRGGERAAPQRAAPWLRRPAPHASWWWTTRRPTASCW